MKQITLNLQIMKSCFRQFLVARAERSPLRRFWDAGSFWEGHKTGQNLTKVDFRGPESGSPSGVPDECIGTLVLYPSGLPGRNHDETGEALASWRNENPEISLSLIRNHNSS
ncbi:hypothetical protein [Hungatella sp.]|uniref:hypothetical protein n=1 Tax=Hungatella sp. TaxID=2613924 RepID=UPI003996C5D8